MNCEKGFITLITDGIFVQIVSLRKVSENLSFMKCALKPLCKLNLLCTLPKAKSRENMNLSTTESVTSVCFKVMVLLSVKSL